MPYARILAEFYSTPLAMLPEKVEALARLLHLKAAGGHVRADEVAAIVAARRPDGVQIVGRVAVLPVFGILAQRVGMLEQASGGISTEAIGVSLDRLAADRSVRSIVLAIDSPGGSVYGMTELADKVRSIREQKKIVAVADSTAASAAYWLAAQASEVYATPGGMVGSIGTLYAHMDESEKLAAEGIKPTIITSVPHKAEALKTMPLTDEAKADLESKVRHYHTIMVRDIARGRGLTEARVEKDFGQGRMLTPAAAKAAGMIDGVATLEQVLRRLGAADEGPPLAARLAAIQARAVEVE